METLIGSASEGKETWHGVEVADLGIVSEASVFDAASIFGTAAATHSEQDMNSLPELARARADSVASSSSTMPPATPSGSKPTLSRRRTQPEPVSRIFINNLPDAEQEALSTFYELRENDFQSKGLGRSNQQEEMMVCDCTFNENSDDPEDACGLHSNCINRMTQVECIKGQCQTRGHCQNQRFSRKQYADIEIVKTEKKGYGIRAGRDMQSETFIYEYIGEVISETAFRKRIKDYADEGIQHFYFMMLQKEEYIDATKRGGKARFLNHSCNPNCYVAKWVVGKRMRMGIFAKRDIEEGEELTFNYNVDRYGYDAQICYCGEPNCSGFIGGKVQTDLAAMDDLYLDALGVSEEIAALGLKGNKKKRARKLDEDFTPTLRPMEANDVPKVVAALRQATNNRQMLVKLMQRLEMTHDVLALREITRMHGFALMTSILNGFMEDEEIVSLALGSMQQWKVANRSKIDDSKIEEPVRRCLETTTSDAIRKKAESLATYWKDRPEVFRIPRRVHVPDTADDATNGDASGITLVYDKPRYVSSTYVPTPKASTFTPAPVVRPTIQPRPKPVSSTPTPTVTSTPNPLLDKNRLEIILAQAQANQEAAAREAAAAAELKAVQQAQGSTSKRRSEHEALGPRRKKGRVSNEEKKEKKLMKLVGEFVVKTMSKYQYMMDRETFKKHAKECTQVLVDKEKRGKTYQEGKLEKLTDEKRTKLKAFIKEYTHKILKKLKDRGKLMDAPSKSSSRRRESTADPDRREGTSDSQDNDKQLVNEMFGNDEMDMEMDLDGDEEDDQAGSPFGIRSRDLISLEESSVSTPTTTSPTNAARIATHALTPDTPPYGEFVDATKT